jgi:hypothetical protein
VVPPVPDISGVSDFPQALNVRAIRIENRRRDRMTDLKAI